LGYDVDPRSTMSSNDMAGWERLAARFLIVRGSHSRDHGTDELIDTSDILGQWFRANETRMVVLRPDRFVAAAESTGLGVPRLPGIAVDIRTPLTAPLTARPEGISS
jgi:3-(3-hydroxy-phenyl)propionate hydroxylase